MSYSNVLTACDHLIDLHAWRADKIDPHGWIANFDVSDRPLAAELLRRFTFYADPLVDQLYLSAFQTLSNIAAQQWQTFDAAKQDWRTFLSGALITWVQGERPHPADSGQIFIRKARQLLGFAEKQMCSPEEAVRRIGAGHSGAVIFVDDFVGSGEQFLTTWARTYPDQNLPAFKTALAARPNVFYCNLMTTEWGVERITMGAPEVTIACGNIISRASTLVGAGSASWPTTTQLIEIQALVKAYSAKLGYGEDGGGEWDWEGFHKLGLGLAFEHSTPDASLPIFHSQENGWTPLVRRT